MSESVVTVWRVRLAPARVALRSVEAEAVELAERTGGSLTGPHAISADAYARERDLEARRAARQ